MKNDIMTSLNYLSI